MATEHLQNIRRWAEQNRYAPDYRIRAYALRLQWLFRDLEATTDAAEAKRIGNEIADCAFEVAKAHRLSPWDFFSP